MSKARIIEEAKKIGMDFVENSKGEENVGPRLSTVYPYFFTAYYRDG